MSSGFGIGTAVAVRASAMGRVGADVGGLAALGFDIGRGRARGLCLMGSRELLLLLIPCC